MTVTGQRLLLANRPISESLIKGTHTTLGDRATISVSLLFI